MAQRIIGLDIGARNIRVVVLESTLRAVRLIATDTEPIPWVTDMAASAGEPDPRTQENQEPTAEEIEEARADAETKVVHAALQALKARGSLEADHVVATLPGDSIFARILSFPFSDPKRLSQVVGFEMEEHIPHDLADVVVDHQVLVERDDGTVRVLAVAAPLSVVAQTLHTLGVVGLDPRIISLSTVAYARSLAVEKEAAAELSTPCIAVVDIGHRRTEIAVLMHGQLAFARTVRRGGLHLVRTLAKELGSESLQAAERTLAAHGRLLPGSDREDSSTEHDPETVRIATAIEAGLQPILRDINQSLRSHERIFGEPVGEILLAGSLANLPGLAEAMHATLEVPASPLSELSPEMEITASLTAEEIPSIAKAAGLALELARGGSREAVNFRRGPFAYKGDFQYLVERTPALIAMVAAILIALTGWFAVYRRNLVHERERLASTLQSVTKDLAGKAIDDPDLASTLIQSPPSKGYLDALPQRTGTWVLLEVNRVIEKVRNSSPSSSDKPAPKEQPGQKAGGPSAPVSGFQAKEAADSSYNVEIEQFEMEGTQGQLRGQASVLEALEMMVQELRARPCFTKVSVEDTDKVAFARHKGWLTFQVKYMLDCDAVRRLHPEKKKGKQLKTGKAITLPRAGTP